jgi:hypothetical protein
LPLYDITKPTCEDDLPGRHQVGMVAGIRLE